MFIENIRLFIRLHYVLGIRSSPKLVLLSEIYKFTN